MDKGDNYAAGLVRMTQNKQARSRKQEVGLVETDTNLFLLS